MTPGSWRRSTRFNGAAPRGARNFGYRGVGDRPVDAASTGPRHGGRGIPMLSCRVVSEAVHASTGPRHGGRGIAANPGDLVEVRFASTGPRHGGRGIQPWQVESSRVIHRFNGAAPRGARNSTFCKHLGLRMQSRWLRAVLLFPNVRVRRNGASGGSRLSSAREWPRTAPSARCRSRPIRMSKKCGD